MRKPAPKPEMGALPAKSGAKSSDHVPVEQTPGRAVIARRGIALTLSELVEKSWLSLVADALDLINPMLHHNARPIFNLAEKAGILQGVSWT
jgi:hypothetical protein